MPASSLLQLAMRRILLAGTIASLASPLASQQAVTAGPTVAASTTLERMLWATTVGFLGYLAVDRIDRRERFGHTRSSVVVGYSAGAILGVGVVTLGREGLRPARLARGAVLGIGIGLLGAWASCDVLDSVDPGGRCGDFGNVLRTVTIGLSIPIGLSSGHGNVGGR